MYTTDTKPKPLIVYRTVRLVTPIHLSYSISGQISLLKNIKKLSFYNTNFSWEEMGVLSKLPRLEVMKLERSACKGQKWGLKEDETFCRLVFLKFEGVDLEHWEVNDDNFPKLERLILYDCSRLEEIPSSFEDIQTLKSIKLRRCLLSAVTSAKKIEESQHDYGNTDMVVIEENTICQVSLLFSFLFFFLKKKVISELHLI
nr:disease resistance protein RPP13-like isoform X6 [Ipomoea batatas]